MPLIRPGMPANAAAFGLNISSSVLIVLVNKLVMDSKSGYGFHYATTLCALHFLFCAASIWCAQRMGLAPKGKLPVAEVIVYAITANVSIASLNISLLVNSVGFYQVAKLLIVPFVCIVEVAWGRRRFTPPVALSIVLVLLGVGTVSISDVSVRTLGLVIAAVSVVSSGMQQISCGVLQRKHQLTAQQLLAHTAYVQGWMLLLVGPFVDRLVSSQWIGVYKWSLPAGGSVLLSCTIALVVNLSQFMCLGRFSAVTFQVLGHSKTIVVLLISWLGLHEAMSVRKLVGMGMAVAGMVLYGVFTGTGSKPLSASEHLKGAHMLPTTRSTSGRLKSGGIWSRRP